MDLLREELLCSHCNLKFISGFIYNLHLKLVHKKVLDDINSIKKEPKIEKESLESKSELVQDQNAHISHINSKQKSFQCETCDYSTFNRSHLK